MSGMAHKAIVFNCGYNGLSIIQELASHGVTCIAMDCRRSIGTFSRYARFVKCPDPSTNETGFFSFLYQFCRSEKTKPVLFPTNDNWAMAISKKKDLLKEVAIPCVGDWEAVSLFLDKGKFGRIGGIEKWLTPRTWSAQKDVEISEEFFPIVAKPISRRFSSDDTESKPLAKALDRLRLRVLRTREELEDYLEKEKEFLGNILLQEFIRGNSGNMHTVGIYADEGHQILGMFSGKKLRGYPAQEGDCIAGTNCKVPEHVLENTFRIVQATGYSGIAEFEYMKNSQTGEFKLIEINPRSWSWIGITPACGVSLPWIAYQDLTGGERLQQNSFAQEDGSVLYAKILQDWWNCLFAYRKEYPAWAKSQKEWKEEISSFKVRIYAEFNARDWPVSVRAIADFIFMIFRRSLKRIIRPRKR